MIEPKYIIKDGECSLCGERKEAALFQTKLLWFWTITMAICETCVSKIFRNFGKEK